MSYQVFPLAPSYNLTHSLKLATFIADMGDGFEQRVNKNLTFGPRGDGLGTTNGTSYKGLNVFNVNLQHMRHVDESTTEYANVLWDFYIDHLGPLTPFYFYNPVESAPDVTGEQVKGRYLVRFGDPTLSRENFVWHLYNASITLIEVRA